MFGASTNISPLAHALMNRKPKGGMTPPKVGAAPHIPKAPSMGIPRRTYSRPVASGLKPSALMPKFGIGF